MKILLELILACDGAVLYSAASPEELDFGTVYPYERWGVVTRWWPAEGSSYTKCVASVDLRGAKDYRKAADRSVRVVRDWLIAGDATNDFDIVDYLADGPTINVTFGKGANDD